jgi:effector-binding domain-containing protein
VSYDIRACDLFPQPTAVVRARLRRPMVGVWLAGAYRRVNRALLKEGVRADGAPFARYTVVGDEIEIEAGVPVVTAVTGDGEVVASGLPGGPVAMATHLGGYDLIDGAYRELDGWLRRNDLVEAGPHWEVYLSGPVTERDPRHWRTDIVVPYRWAPVPVLNPA